MYMGASIRPHEELRAGMLDADPCSICRARSETDCDNCQTPICRECAVKCAGCKPENEYCIACAIKNGYAQIDGKFYCENCAGELEPEPEEARR